MVSYNMENYGEHIFLVFSREIRKFSRSKRENLYIFTESYYNEAEKFLFPVFRSLIWT